MDTLKRIKERLKEIGEILSEDWEELEDFPEVE